MNMIFDLDSAAFRWPSGTGRDGARPRSAIRGGARDCVGGHYLGEPVLAGRPLRTGIIMVYMMHIPLILMFGNVM
jgi:hypothetical protein